MPNLHLLSPAGFRATGVYAGVKSAEAPDIGLLVCDHPATAAAAFTTNRVFAAPIKVGREHVAGGVLRAIVVNSGNANACTGLRGEKDARTMCALAARELGCEARQVLPSSTGIIGHALPMEKIEAGIRAAAGFLGNDLEHALLFGSAILTTDTKRKTAAVEFHIGRHKARIAGVCKGAGMIGPRLAVAPGAGRGAAAGSSGHRGGAADASRHRAAAPSVGKSARGAGARHATMLAYLTSDVAISAAALRSVLGASSERSFNAVTIDDHASTNDTAAILASGAGGAAVRTDADRRRFADALDEVCQSLAYQIAADGEGATKTLTINVRGAASDSAARAMARAIANSPLVKCAMNGNDPNWGRIVSAAGYAGAPFDPDRATLRLQGTVVFRNGTRIPFDADALSAALAAKDVAIELTARDGAGAATVWTCDFSKEYVSINADYHT
jgi:glutamate N-acetyltransferase/amino-acid N-acetyltransferase